MARVNEFGQPVGPDIGEWEPPPLPTAETLRGRTVTLEPLVWETHGTHLFETLSEAPGSLWTYMPFGPFHRLDDLRGTVESMTGQPDWQPYAAVVDDRPLGFASYLRIQPLDGVIEIGAITFPPPLQRTTPATETLYLLMRNVFELGYRRCEWKCDSLNEPSRRAAERLGFRYEGTFRQATHYKGRSRDTAWFAVIDSDWPGLELAFRRWLAPTNFDPVGTQRRSLGEIREEADEVE